jgi:hypothetical protein
VRYRSRINVFFFPFFFFFFFNYYFLFLNDQNEFTIISFLFWGPRLAAHCIRPFLITELQASSAFSTSRSIFSNVLNFRIRTKGKDKRERERERARQNRKEHVLLAVSSFKQRRAFRRHMGCCLLLQKAQEGSG